MTAKPAVEFLPVEYLCLRYGQTAKGVELLVFKPVPTSGAWTADEAEVIALQASKLKLCHPGACYIIPTAADKQSFRSAACKWTRRCPDEVLERELQAAAEAYKAQRRKDQLAKRENSPMRGLEAPIRSLRHAYRNLSGQDRLAFETWVLFQLRKWE